MAAKKKIKLPPLRRFLLIGIIFLLVIIEVIALYPNLTTPLERLELSARDLLVRIRGTRAPNSEIVIVAIDDFSFNYTGLQWPWKRTYLAEIVDWLNEAGASIIGLDIMLFEEDSTAGGDEALAAALADTPQTVGVLQIFRSRNEIGPGQYMYSETIKLPLSIYREVLEGTGTTAINLDDDAISRSVQAYDDYADQTYQHWAFEVARLYLDVDPASNFSATGMTFDGKQVPLYQKQFMVNFAGPAQTYPYYSAALILEGDYPPETFRNKIVLIGATSITLHDVYPTPFSARQQTPGVEIVANAIATLLSGKFLHSLPPWVNLLFLPFMALLAVLINRVKTPGLAIGLMIGTMLIFAVAAYFLFARANLYIPIISPELMLFLGVVLPTLEQAVSQEIEKRRVRNLFVRFISPEMVEQLLTTRDISKLNKRAELTILFSDIRGFTTLSEKLTPEEVVNLLNPYLEEMTSVIYKHGGTVDKYEGDAIVAFFGEPVSYANHAVRAARAAVEMIVVLADLRERWKAEGLLSDKFEIGIGLNSGSVFVGLLGSAQRINYTVIGDNVNLAARLQDLTKTYSCPIVVSESTAEAIKNEFNVEYIEATSVRGKREKVKIYKILGPKEADETEQVQATEE